MKALLVAITFTISAGLSAQQPSLTGRVLDSTNAVLPGVTVEATPAGGGIVQTADRTGRHLRAHAAAG